MSETPPVVEVNTEETAQQAYVKLGIARLSFTASKSPIKAVYPLKHNRVMVLCEDGNRIWFTPGVDEGNAELQVDYQKFMKTSEPALVPPTSAVGAGRDYDSPGSSKSSTGPADLKED